LRGAGRGAIHTFSGAAITLDPFHGKNEQIEFNVD
jgi:hypothetical protein